MADLRSDSNQGDSHPGLAQPDLTGRVEVRDLGLSSRAWLRRRVDPGAPLRVKDPRRALEALHRLLDLVERETKPRDVVDRALAIVLEDAAAVRGAVLWVERGSEITPLALRLPPGDAPGARVVVDRTALDFVLESGIAVAPALAAAPGATASAYVPLCRSGPGRALGAVWLERAPGGPAFEERDLECAMLLANHMVRSVERVFTQRRREERVRARWRDRFSAIVDAIPEGIAVVRPDGTLDALNGSAREFFSRAHRKAPSGAATLVSTLSIADLVAEAFQGSRPARRDVVLADGEVIEVGAFAVSNPPVSVAVVLRDVTRERAREQYLRETERTRELGASLAGVAHELNNPLTSVMGFAELLASDVPPAQAEAALHVREQAARCLAIVQDILAFSSRRRREDRKLDLGEVAQNVRRLLQGDLEDSKTTLTVEGRAGPALADPRLVQQVLVNLVRNAVQAISEAQRPGAERPEATVRRVIIRLGQRGTRRTIEVEDSGPGIDAATQARLFKPFFTTRQKGTGLGLSISREIIQDYGGDMTVESAPGRTVFRLDLPAWDAAAAGTGARGTNRLSASKAAAAAAAPAGSGVDPATVVIADDDPAIRRLLTQSLVKLGHSVRAHVSGEAAWEDLSGPGTIDAAFLDLRMPPPDGLELRRRLQAAGNPLADRIVIITGEVDDAVLTQVTKEGARLLRKPFRLADAAALVEELRADARRSSTHIKAAARERDLAGIRALVVDDVRASRRLVAALFRPRGADVAEAGDGPDAVRQVLGARGAGKKPFDLILLDMNLPGLDGAGTARRLRELGITTPILAVTGSIRPQDRDALLGAGCDALLGKPFQNKELLDAVRRLLKRDGTAPTPSTPIEAPPPLERLRSLREEEGEFAPLLAAYRDDAAEHGAALGRARAGGDAAGVRAIAHKVAGTGGSYGFPDLSAAARLVEERLDRGEPLGALRADLDRLVTLLAGVAGR